MSNSFNSKIKLDLIIKMFIVEVIPLVPLPPQVPQLLSYFFNRSLQRGAIVEVLMGNRKVPAIVISSSLIQNQKIALKNSGFQLKKITSLISEEPRVTDIQFKIAAWLSKKYFSSPGISFKTLLPKFFLDPKYSFSFPSVIVGGQAPIKPKLLLTGAKKTINEIRLEIKKTIENKKQALIVIPEISIARDFYDILAGYYETSLLNSTLSKKQAYKEWLRISSGDAELIIGTRQALFAPFLNLGLIIVEDPANEAYKSDMSPKYNTYHLAEKISEIYSADLVYVSPIPDIISYQSVRDNLYSLEDKSGSKHPLVSIQDNLQEFQGGNYSILSRELRDNVEKYLGNNKKILIFSSRKGYSTSFVCENCKFHFKCPQCLIPLRIYRQPEEMLICNICSLSKKIPDSCPNCHSYKLKAAGYAGSEKIKEELEFILKNKGINKEIFVFDKNSIKNLKQEAELIKKIQALDSFVCIATQSIFSYRFNLNFDLVGIPNLDGLTTIPDFKAEEDLFMQFEKINDFQSEKIIIQTYGENRIAPFLKNKNYKEFYDKDILSRKIFGYPPFTRLVKLSISSADKNKTEQEARILSEKLKRIVAQAKLDSAIKIMGPSPAFIEKRKDRFFYNLILKLSHESNVGQIVKYVPSNWSIDVDPKSIL